MHKLPGVAAAAVCILIASAVARAQVVPNEYILLMQDQAGVSQASTVRAQAVQPQQARVRTMLESQNAEIVATYSSLVTGFAVRLPAGGDPEADRVRLESLPGVVRVYPVKLVFPHLSAALPISGVPDAWNAIGGKDKAGAGIKIGIIDSGIDITHPMFQDSSLTAPAGFPKAGSDADLAYTNSKVIVARNYRSSGNTSANPGDVRGHGSACASVAAGVTWNSPYGLITGVAPKAWLGNYKVFGDSGGAATSSILQALDDAFNDGMDVVNLSLGGPADSPEVDVLATAAQRAVSRGMVVTISAGNAGSDPNTIESPGIALDAITVGATVNGHANAATLTPSGGPAIAGIPGSRTLNRVTFTGSLKDVADLDPTGLACSAFPAGSFSGRVALILRGTCNFEDKVSNVQSAGAVGAVVYTDSGRPSAITMSITTTDLPAVMVSYADGVTLKQVAAGGGNLAVDVTVGSVNIVDGYSSRGPAIDSSLKPDLVAVGSTMVMAKPGGTFTIADGTSFSSPMLAGAAALVKSARPGLTPLQYKSLLVNAARPLYVRGTSPSPTTEAGAGVLQVLASLGAGASLYPTSLSFGIGTATGSTTRTFTVTNLESQSDTFTLEPVAVTGVSPTLSDSVITLGKGESRTVTMQWNLGGLAAGAYQGYIRIFGDRAVTQQRLPYWYGVPSQTVKYLTVIYSPSCSRPNGQIGIMLRITDAQGLPVTTVTPTATATDGNTAPPSMSPYQTNRNTPVLPGTYLLSTTAAAIAGTQTFSITAGDVTKTTSVPVTTTCSN